MAMNVLECGPGTWSGCAGPLPDASLQDPTHRQRCTHLFNTYSDPHPRPQAASTRRSGAGRQQHTHVNVPNGCSFLNELISDLHRSTRASVRNGRSASLSCRWSLSPPAPAAASLPAHISQAPPPPAAHGAPECALGTAPAAMERERMRAEGSYLPVVSGFPPTSFSSSRS